MAQKLKTPEQMQRHFKGMANHYRIQILLLVSEEPNITVDTLTDILDANFKTISQHTRYLAHAGLLTKKYKAQYVLHNLSPYGEIFVKFIRDFRRVGSS